MKEIHSNVGVGLVSAVDVKKAASDAMAVSFGDFKFVSDVALGRLELKNEMDHIADLQERAIFRLGAGDFPMHEARQVLGEVAKKFPKLEKQVANSITYLATQLVLNKNLALSENLDENGLGNLDDNLRLVLQKRAIRYLGFGHLPFKESRDILNRVGEKFPELAEEVDESLARLKKEQARQKNSGDAQNHLPEVK